MIEVKKGQDRIPCDPNANLEALVQTHGADSVLVDGISVAEIAERAAIEAAAEAEEAGVKAGTAESTEQLADAPAATSDAAGGENVPAQPE